jgi:hypothetical protein
MIQHIVHVKGNLSRGNFYFFGDLLPAVWDEQNAVRFEQKKEGAKILFK